MPRVGILVGVLIAHLVAMPGCYEPELRDCTVRCAAPTDCTGGQICRDDGWCAMASVQDCPTVDEENQVGSDAAVAPPDSSTSSPGLCEMGCTTGSCIDGVCGIDCGTAMSCQDKDITCPANLPCRVVCGERSCAKKIFCGLASSCEVQCTGDYSCLDDIVCNANRCDVDCIGASSCKKTKCSNSCACDVTCSGIGSCTDPNECPDSACKLGEGCTSLLAGCNQC